MYTLNVEQKIKIMEIAMGNIERYKEMVDLILTYSPRKDILHEVSSHKEEK